MTRSFEFTTKLRSRLLLICAFPGTPGVPDGKLCSRDIFWHRTSSLLMGPFDKKAGSWPCDVTYTACVGMRVRMCVFRWSNNILKIRFNTIHDIAAVVDLFDSGMIVDLYFLQNEKSHIEHIYNIVYTEKNISRQSACENKVRIVCLRNIVVR